MRASLICRVVAVISFAALCLTVTVRPAHSATTNVTLTGTLSCAHCQGVQPMHKGYTQFTWALHSVDLGDDVVLLVQDKTYTLKGDTTQFRQFMSSTARVTGYLDGNTLNVESIHRTTAND